MFTSQPLLLNKDDFVSHKKLQSTIETVMQDAMKARKLETELYQLGKEIYATLDKIKQAGIHKVIELKDNYIIYKKKLTLYLNQRLTIIKQLPGIITLIQKDTFDAGNLREEDHIAIIDENYAWLDNHLATIITACIPLAVKDRNGSGSIFRNNEPTSILRNDLISMTEDKDILFSEKWLESCTGLSFPTATHTLSESKESKTPVERTAAKLYGEFEVHLSKVNKQLTQAKTSMERLTSQHLINISNGLFC